MHLFHAGNTFRKYEEMFVSMGAENRLLSYADIKAVKGSWMFWLKDAPAGTRLFVDSGAFSAYTRGVVIDIEEFVEFIKQHEDRLFCYAALDVIGDWKGTRKNYDRMKELGVDPIPCYHYGEPLIELEKYCEDGVEYIALGGAVEYASSRAKLQEFLDSCWSVLKDHFPIKVHGFGITAQWALERYPFYSCDSTAAICGGANGRVATFDKERLKWKNWMVMGKQCMFPEMVDGLHKEGSQHLNRKLYNIKVMMRMEEYITRLWERRGVVWDD